MGAAPSCAARHSGSGPPLPPSEASQGWSAVTSGTIRGFGAAPTAQAKGIPTSGYYVIIPIQSHHSQRHAMARLRVGAIATCVGLAARAPPGQAGGGLAQRTASRSGGVREACTHSGELSTTASVSIGQEARRRQAGGYHEKGGTSKGHRKLSPAKHPEKMHASTTLLS